MQITAARGTPYTTRIMHRKFPNISSHLVGWFIWAWVVYTSFRGSFFHPSSRAIWSFMVRHHVLLMSVIVMVRETRCLMCVILKAALLRSRTNQVLMKLERGRCLLIFFAYNAIVFSVSSWISSIQSKLSSAMNLAIVCSAPIATRTSAASPSSGVFGHAH